MVGYLTSIGHLGYFRLPISEILGLKGVKMSQKCMVGYLTSIGHLRYVRWTISDILGLKGVKISRNGQN